MCFASFVVLLSMVLPAQGAPTLRGDAGTAAVRMADLDGDGLLDRLLFGGGDRLTISLNRGARAFEEIRQELPPVAVADVLIDDLNGDGHTDLYLVSPRDNVALTGDGMGGFVDTTAELGLEDGGIGVRAERVDIDADGLLDVLLHNRDGDVIFWGNRTGAYERDGTPPQDPLRMPDEAHLLVPLPHASSAGATEAGDDATRVRRPGVNLTREDAGQDGGTSLTGFPVIGPVRRIPCLPRMRDFSTGNCLTADSTPTFGRLYPLGTEFNIDPVGRVGIGTTSPSAALDVIGSVEISGDLSVSGAGTGFRAALQQVDGPGSEIDADMLDGLSSNAFASSSHQHSFAAITGFATDEQIPNEHSHSADSIPAWAIDDGEGSSLDADLLDGNSSSAFASTSHTHVGLWSVSGSNLFYNVGNVGIGTPSPAEKLTVAGIVRSTTGGFRFPDGSLQLSADTGGGVPTGFMILGSALAPATGYAVAGRFLDGWLSRASMMVPRANFGAAVVNGKVYAVGLGAGGSTLEEYDPTTNAWTVKAPMLIARTSLGVAAVSGKLYAIGGNSMGPLQNAVEEYDPTAGPLGTWTTKAPLPSPTALLATAVVSGKIYVFGGQTLMAPSTTAVWEFDPTAGPLGSWTARAPMPTARRSMAATAVNGRVHVMGGVSTGPSLTTVEVYDPALGPNGSWVSSTSLPTARHSLAAEAVNGRIHVIGGFNGAALDSVEEYDPTTNTWTTNTDLPTARYGLGAASVGGKILAIGGNGASGSLAVVEEYSPGPGLYLYRRN